MTQIQTIEHVEAPAIRQHPPQRRMEPIGGWVPVELVCESPLTRIYRARARREVASVAAGYALKVLREERQTDAGAVAVICREVQVARAVRHPHVIPVLAAGLHGPPYYIVTPWLPGRTLADRLAQDEPLDLPVVLWIVRQVAEAIDGLCAAGWMHGDIKPANVLISPEGHVTLLDLGFARRLDDKSAEKKSLGKAAVDWRYFTGTGSYLAPELLSAAPTFDIRSDIYSLGVMFFEMLTLRLPFSGGDLAEVIAQHRGSAAANPRRFVPQIPVEVIHLVRQMLSKQPLRRPQTPQELIERLVELEILSFDARTLVGGWI